MAKSVIQNVGGGGASAPGGVDPDPVEEKPVPVGQDLPLYAPGQKSEKDGWKKKPVRRSEGGHIPLADQLAMHRPAVVSQSLAGLSLEEQLRILAETPPASGDRIHDLQVAQNHPAGMAENLAAAFDDGKETDLHDVVMPSKSATAPKTVVRPGRRSDPT